MSEHSFSRLGKHSPWLKELRQLQQASERRRQGLFLVEGLKILEEARSAGLALRNLLVRPDRWREAATRQWIEDCQCPVHEVAAESLARLSSTETDQGLIGVVEIPRREIELIAELPSVLVLDGISDPGNLGTLLRAARACGVGGVILRGGADPYGAKVVRASAGALFRTALWREVTLTQVRDAGFTLMAAVVRGGENYYSLTLPGRPAWLLGAEGAGLPDEVLRQCQIKVTLPMEGECESLNVAMAGTVLMFDWRRRLGQT